jgi:hypothetical protein
MRWFKREMKKDVFSKLNEELQERVFDLYPVGREFDYMGAVCRVAMHRFFLKGICCGSFYRANIHPAINCDYVDKNGLIRSVEFTCLEVDAWEAS